MEKDVKVVEKLEDIDIMEGLNFKLNQRISKIEDEQRKLKKKVKRNNRIENILLATALIITLGLTIVFGYYVFKDDNKDIKNCVEKGHSQAYCEKSILGL